MKKILALILALVLCFGLVACGSSDADNGTTNKQDNAAQEYVGTWKGSECWGGSIVDGVEVTLSEVYDSLLSNYDTTLAGKALWEKGQEIGMTFTDPETETRLKEYMEAQ
jgi:hypothetical protein